MNPPQRSAYTPLDFVGWQATESLVLTPKFQRRGVWTTPKRSYLIDTLIRGMPVPPLYLRVRQSDDRKRMVREVVDGQQRISAVLDFISGGYALSRALDAPYRGRLFRDLTEEQQDSVRQYSFICEVFHGVSDSDILEVFARLNTYSVQLNDQELRNGSFFGMFKQTVYRLANARLEYWRRANVFGEQQIARMLEAELVSELMVAQLHGMQDKKKSLTGYYKQYDEAFPEQRAVETRFSNVLDLIGELGALRETQFHRVPMFYTLFCVLYHRLYGLPREGVATPAAGNIDGVERSRLWDAVVMLSQVLVDEKETGKVAAGDSKFVTACLRQTDNLKPRQERFRTLYTTAFE